jgi:hypothetical protein
VQREAQRQFKRVRPCLRVFGRQVGLIQAEFNEGAAAIAALAGQAPVADAREAVAQAGTAHIKLREDHRHAAAYRLAAVQRRLRADEQALLAVGGLPRQQVRAKQRHGDLRAIGGGQVTAGRAPYSVIVTTAMSLS